MIIGICGKSGCGKSTLARQIITLTNNKAVHLDIDKVGHDVLFIPNVKNELIKEFGSSIIDTDNIDRKKLGEIVFNSRKSMKVLTDITWKYMQIEIDRFLELNKDKIIILDWILLSSSKYFQMCDIRILLDIPYEVRKDRAIKRDNITEENFVLRENASIEFNHNDFNYVFKTNDEDEIGKLVRTL